MKTKIILVKCLFISFINFSQNVGINSTGAAPSDCAALDVDILNKGVLIPRVALTSRTIYAPVTGAPVISLLIYNTATAGVPPNNVSPGFYYWDGSRWLRISTGGWGTTGNYSTNPATNFLGTIDAQDLALRTNNTEHFRLTSNGNVGIGTTSPLVKFQLEGNSGNLMNLVNTSTTINNPTWNNYIQFGDGLQFAGYLGDGSSGKQLNYTGLFDYEINIGSFSSNTFASNNASLLLSNSTYLQPSSIILSTLNQERVIIRSNGNMGVGTLNPTFRLEVNGTTACAGNIWTSDVRKKQNIQTLGFSALDKVMQLHPVSYEWKEVIDGGMKGTQIGFIAQELEEVLPSSVVTAENEEQSKGVKYIELIPILTKAIQEQQEIIKINNDRINTLESQTLLLQQEINTLKSNK